MSGVPTDQLILAIDQGTTNTKAALIGADGQLVRGGSAPVGISSPRPGWVEQDAERIWTSVLEAVAACLEALTDAEIIGIALSTQRESVVGWRAEHRDSPRPGDRVAGPTYDGLVRRSLHRCRIGNWSTTAAASAWTPMFSAPKMRWILDHLPTGVPIDDVRLGHGRFMADLAADRRRWSTSAKPVTPPAPCCTTLPNSHGARNYSNSSAYRARRYPLLSRPTAASAGQRASRC